MTAADQYDEARRVVELEGKRRADSLNANHNQGNADPDTTVVAVRHFRDVTGDPLPAEPKTELGYANRFVHVYGDQLRYIPAWNRWLLWDGYRWNHDATMQHRRWMTMIARAVTTKALAAGDGPYREARRFESAAAIRGALTLAASHENVVVEHTDLDADPFLLNCKNGTLDLRTGELRPPDRADLLTKMSGAFYRPEAVGLEFDEFLERIQPDPQMRQFLARLLGHAMEGRQVEHLLPILFGDGANGKSTLLTVVKLALGDYGGEAAPALLTARNFDAHPTEIADLFGVRLAVVQETDKGRRLAEGTVKRLTGGDTIKARRMRENFWEFEPSHTFIMATNYKPIVTGTDQGIWRRLRLVPFKVEIPEAEWDLELGDKLAFETDRVLAWLVAGYQDWKANGLDEPQAVTDATADYRAESDAVGRFLDERCHVVASVKVRSSDLFKAWSNWCVGEGIESGTNKALTTTLQNRGFDTKRTKTGAIWQGIGLLSDSTGDGW